MELPAVAQLEKDPKYGPVHQLLKIFLTQRLNAYREFQTANSECLQSYGNQIVNPFTALSVKCKHVPSPEKILNFYFWWSLGLVDEDCVTKMRLLSLVHLASDEFGKIPYTSIKDTLQVYKLRNPEIMVIYFLVSYCSVCFS